MFVILRPEPGIPAWPYPDAGPRPAHPGGPHDHHRPDPQAGGGPSRLTGRLRAILTVVLIADVLDLMDSTITNIAAPTIVRDIGGGQSLIKWLGASYALALGVLLTWAAASVTGTASGGCS